MVEPSFAASDLSMNALWFDGCLRQIYSESLEEVAAGAKALHCHIPHVSLFTSFAAQECLLITGSPTPNVAT